MTSTNSLPVAGHAPPRPPFWLKLPVIAGNLVQLGGLAAGVLLFALAAIALHGAAATGFADLGIVLVSFSSHAIGHWLVGGQVLLVVIAWAAGTVLVATFNARGDYAKARAALRAGSVA